MINEADRTVSYGIDSYMTLKREFEYPAPVKRLTKLEKLSPLK